MCPLMKCKSCEGPIKDKLTKIYDAAEGFRNKNNSHSDQMKIWIEKIKVKTRVTILIHFRIFDPQRIRKSRWTKAFGPFSFDTLIHFRGVIF